MIYWFYSYSKFLLLLRIYLTAVLKLFTVEYETTFSGRLFHNGLILFEKLYLRVSYLIWDW